MLLRAATRQRDDDGSPVARDAAGQRERERSAFSAAHHDGVRRAAAGEGLASLRGSC